MDSMKTQKDMTVKDKAPRPAGVQYAIGGERGGGGGGRCAINNSSTKVK